MNKHLFTALIIASSTIIAACGSEDKTLGALMDKQLELNSSIETLHLTWDQSLYSKISQTSNDSVELNDPNLIGFGVLNTVENEYPIVYSRNGISVYEFINVTMDDFNSFTTRVVENGSCKEIHELNLTTVKCVFDDNLKQKSLTAG